MSVLECESFSCKQSGVLGILSGESLSPAVPITCGVFCSDSPVAGLPTAKSTSILLTPANEAAALAAPVFPQPTLYTPSCPQVQWSPYYSYKVGDKVYAQINTASPFLAYQCTSAIPDPIPLPNTMIPTNAAYWTQLSAAPPIVPWCPTAAYTVATFQGAVSYRGKVFVLDGNIAANPAGNPPPDVDTVTWDERSPGFRAQLSVSTAGSLLLYNYFVMNPEHLPQL